MIVSTRFENYPVTFNDPHYTIACYNPDQLVSCFEEIEAALQKGYYAAGFFSYEAGACFEERLLQRKIYDFPLACFGIYSRPLFRDPCLNKSLSDFNLKNPRLATAYPQYEKNIKKIRTHIQEGDVYQITYCIKLKFDFSGNPAALYSTLLAKQPVPYPAFIQTDQFHILSCSPELFIRKKADRITTKPMKGTWPRANTITGDLINRFRFNHDAKNRAENVMIADLLRNDLGRIGAAIKTPRLCEISKYRTLYQMTSTVTGVIDKKISLYRIFSALFPSGSVTGAPKIRSMEIIKDIENEDRQIYTGAIGYITPERDMFFNIPIRTVLIQGSSAEMGIGGGIVWDSTPRGEWDEGLLKGRFLTDLMIENPLSLE